MLDSNISADESLQELMLGNLSIFSAKWIKHHIKDLSKISVFHVKVKYLHLAFEVKQKTKKGKCLSDMNTFDAVISEN